MEYIYTTENTCARNIKVEINGNIITNVEFWAETVMAISKQFRGWWMAGQ